MIAVVILAAGASSRMRGRDKLLEHVDGAPLLARQITTARSIADHVYVTLPPPPHPRYELIGKATAVPVPDAAHGLSASLRGGIRALPPETTAALVLLADLPEITAADLHTLLSAHRAHPQAKIWRATTASGQPGHPILFDASLFPAFANLSGDVGAQTVIADNSSSIHLVPLPDNRARTDLDTPEDWSAWRTRTGR